MILNKLPEGVTFIGDPSDFNKESIILIAKEREKQLAAQPKIKVDLQEYKTTSNLHNSDQFQICQFVIDISRITVKGLISMRNFLPSQEYRLLKFRKCARESRKRRKEQTKSTSEQLDIALREIEMLRERIFSLEK